MPQYSRQKASSESGRARLAILPATSHVGVIAQAQHVAELATPFLDDQGPARLTGFFEGMDEPASPAPEAR